MRIDIAFDFAKVYNIDMADVVLGQKFTLLSDSDGRWFSDNDPVLSFKVNGKEIEAEAKELGTTTILIMDDNFAIQKQFTIKVVPEILALATTLNATAGTPVLK
jgi:hypothetical protein